MIALYVIGSVTAIVVLAVKLRDARDRLSRVAHERDAYARTLQMIAPQRAAPVAMPAEGYVLPPAGTSAGHPDRRTRR